MTLARGVALGTIAFVVATAVLTGPLVSAGQLPSRDAGVPAPGTGTATVTVDSVPADAIALEQGQFVSETYHLEAPPAVVNVSGVDGNPVVKYAVDVPALGYSDVNSYQLHSRQGRLELEFRVLELSPRTVTDDEYSGTVAIWLLSHDGEYTSLYQQSVTIEVRGRE